MGLLDSVASVFQLLGFLQFNLPTVFHWSVLGWSCNVFGVVLQVVASNSNVVVALLH